MIGWWCLVVGSFGWKPIPSAARVTRDEVSGLKQRRGELSGRQYLAGVCSSHFFYFLVLSSRQLFLLFFISRDFVPGYSRCARYWLPAKATYNLQPNTNTTNHYIFLFIFYSQQSDHKFCLEDNTERSESNPGRSLGIKTKKGELSGRQYLANMILDKFLYQHVFRIFFI